MGRFQAEARVDDAFAPAAPLLAEIERLKKEIKRAEVMLANVDFTSQAPPEVVEAERDKLERYRRELDALRD